MVIFYISSHKSEDWEKLRKRKEEKLEMKEQRREMTKTCISWHCCSEFKEEKLSYKRQCGLADVTVNIDPYRRMG